MTATDAAAPLSRRARTLQRYEQLTEWPLLFLALLIVPLILVPLFADIPASTNNAMQATLWVSWAVFAVDLSIRTYLAEQRINYLIRHWYDVLIVVLPMLRPLRVVRALRMARLIVVIPFLARAWASTSRILSHRGLQYVLTGGMVAVFACAGLVLSFEKNSGGTIDDYGTALWWAMTTVTTVGYGDTYPETPEGKGVAVFLMLIGISFFSWVTANIAAFLVEFGGGGTDEGVTTRDLMTKLESLEEEVRALRAEQSGRSAVREDDNVTRLN
jgi:voltage-gated potassium channel